MTWVRIFGTAMARSAQPLAMLLFIILVAMIFFSALMFTAEAGVWNDDAGAYLDSSGAPAVYQSIPDCFYWCLITMTTVGYGDIYPVTLPGKIVAMLTSLCGILVLAIPITVISTNFNEEYDKLRKQKEIIKARMLLLKNHFKQKRTGLEALKDEVNDLSKRSLAEFLSEVHDVAEQMQGELTDELQSILQLAFEERERELAMEGVEGEAQVESHLRASLRASSSRGSFSSTRSLLPSLRKVKVVPKTAHTQYRDNVQNNKK